MNTSPNMDDLAAGASGEKAADTPSAEIAKLASSIRGAGHLSEKLKLVDHWRECNNPNLDAALAVLLGDPELENCEAAIRGLMQSGSANAIELVRGAIQDSRPKVRIAVIRSLGETSNPNLIPSILPSLDDEDGRVRDCAMYHITELAGSDTPRYIQKMLADADQFIRRTAKQTLESLAAR